LTRIPVLTPPLQPARRPSCCNPPHAANRAPAATARQHTPKPLPSAFLHTAASAPPKASLPLSSANAPPRGTQLHQTVRRLPVYTRRAAQRRLTGSSVSPPSHTDASVGRSCFRGRLVVVGVQTSRRVASELLSARARSRSASTSSLRTRKARPTRTAGSAPPSIQLRIVCAVTWNCSATCGTVSSRVVKGLRPRSAEVGGPSAAVGHGLDVPTT